MHTEHDRTHGHGLRARPRGRMPYSEPRDLSSAEPVEPPIRPVEPLVRPVDPPIRPVEPLARPVDPVRSAEPPAGPVAPVWSAEPPTGPDDPIRSAEPRVWPRPFDEPSWAEVVEETGGARDPAAHRTWADLENRPFSMPPPPGRWDRPWSQLSRDQLVRPALIVGFIAAAGAGIWLYGWPTSRESPTPEGVPAPAAQRSLPDHDGTITPPGITSSDSPSLVRAPDPPGPASRAKALAEREKEKERETTRGRKPAASLPARPSRPLAISGGEEHRANQGERHREKRRTPKATRPGAIESARPAPATSARTAPSEHARTAPNASGRTAPNARAAPNASPRTAPSVRTGPSARTAPSENARTAPNVNARPRASQAPASPRARIPAPGGGNESRVGTSGTGAAYACRHLGPGDWRYDYCVQVWNNYSRRSGPS
jgi:hypothetical protein